MAITLVKTDSPDPVLVGQPLTYTITIMSLGPGPANNVVLTDTLPATVTFNSASVPCTLGPGNVLTCSLGQIPAGTTRVITIVVTPNAPGLITNLAVAQGSGQNMAQDTETTQVLATTTITVNKTDNPDPVLVGGTLTYTVTVTNTGAAAAANVLLTDTLPASVTFLSASVPCTLGPGNVLTCNLDTIPAAGSATVMITVTPNAPGAIINTATAVGGNTNTATVMETTQVLALTTLTLIKTDSPDPALVGGTLTYTVVATNVGSVAAVGVVLTDILPPSVTFLSSSAPCLLGPGNVLTCTIGTIPMGGAVTVTIQVQPNAPGLITNTATAVGTNTNTAAFTATTLVLATTTLAVAKFGTPVPAFVGGTLTFTVTISNTGTAPAENVVLTDDLPDSVTFLSSSLLCTLGPGNVLTCSVGTIPPLSVATATITVRPNAPGSITNTATAVGTNTNAAAAAIETQVILAADLAVTKTANARAQVGQGLTYTVSVTNNGPSTATGVTLVDTLPADVRFVLATPSQGTCSLTGRTLTCLIGTLAPGETETVTILVVPTSPGPLTNTATVFGNEFDPNPANNTASVTTTAVQCLPGCC